MFFFCISFKIRREMERTFISHWGFHTGEGTCYTTYFNPRTDTSVEALSKSMQRALPSNLGREELARSSKEEGRKVRLEKVNISLISNVTCTQSPLLAEHLNSKRAWPACLQDLQVTSTMNGLPAGSVWQTKLCVDTAETVSQQS